MIVAVLCECFQCALKELSFFSHDIKICTVTKTLILINFIFSIKERLYKGELFVLQRGLNKAAQLMNAVHEFGNSVTKRLPRGETKTLSQQNIGDSPPISLLCFVLSCILYFMSGHAFYVSRAHAT